MKTEECHSCGRFWWDQQLMPLWLAWDFEVNLANGATILTCLRGAENQNTKGGLPEITCKIGVRQIQLRSGLWTTQMCGQRILRESKTANAHERWNGTEIDRIRQNSLIVQYGFVRVRTFWVHRLLFFITQQDLSCQEPRCFPSMRQMVFNC